MPQVEVDETVLQNLQNIGTFVQKAMNNPDARKKMLEAQKVLEPEAVTETDVAQSYIAPVVERMEALESSLKEKEEKEAEAAEEAKKKELEQRWLAGRAKAKEAGYTDEGIEKLEEFMVENGVVDHEIALPAYERENPPPAPVADTAGPFQSIFSEEARTEGDLKPLWDGNEEQFLSSVINQELGRKVY